MKNSVFWDMAPCRYLLCKPTSRGEDGGDTVLRNIGLETLYTAPHISKEFPHVQIKCYKKLKYIFSLLPGKCNRFIGSTPPRHHNYMTITPIKQCPVALNRKEQRTGRVCFVRTCLAQDTCSFQKQHVHGFL
jgi:hypothetical protein